MSTRPGNLHRRTLLRGAGVAMALPWLEAMAPRRAHAATPKRFIVFFTPNGTIADAWKPTGSETNWQLSRILMPLAAYKEDLVVLNGLDNVAATKGPGDDHQKGMGAMLTGTELLEGTQKGGCETCAAAGLAGGPSVDQVVVDAWKASTKFPSLELGVQSGSGGTVWGYSNYRAANKPLPLENNPDAVWKRVFADVEAGGDQALAMRLAGQRVAVANAVRDNFKSLVAKVGAADKRRLEEHMQGVVDLEDRLAKAGVSNAVCTKPAGAQVPGDQTKKPWNENDKFPVIGKLQMDLMVSAMKCDLTRVATIQWKNSVGDNRFTWLGQTRGHHDMSHDPDSTADSKEALTKINVWYAEQLAHLLGELKKAQDADGKPMLDNTVVLWCNELSRGNAHSHPDMPFVLAGGAGGKIETGRFLDYNTADKKSVPHNNLLVSLLRALDVDVSTFGNPAYCTGPLDRL